MLRRTRPEDMNRIESEAGVIATLINHPEFSFYSEYLLPEHFTSKQNQILYRAITGMANENISTIDSFGIIEYIQLHDPDNVGTVTKETIDDFIENSDYIARHSMQEYKVLTSNVYDVAFRREMMVKLDECKSILADRDTEEVRKRVYDIIDGVMSSYSFGNTIVQYRDLIDSLWAQIEERQKNGYSGIPFKFPLLNEYVTIERGELVIFGAQQKVGKSIMLLNCAVDLLRKGYSVLYIDSELSDRLFTARLIAHVSKVKYKKVTTGKYSEEEKKRVLEAKEWIKTVKFQHTYMPIFQSDSLYTFVKQYNHVTPIDVLIVDYFKSTGNDMDAFQTYASMGKCVDIVKNEIAGDMNIAAIGAAQATATNKLADSAKIARNASTIVMLMDKTPEEIDADGIEGGNKKMVVTVNRNGMQHTQGEWINLVFDGDNISYEQAIKAQHIPEEPY